MVGYARTAGEGCSEIKEAVREALIQTGCEELTCDCEKLYVLVSLGIAIAATAIAMLSKNRFAIAEARDAIARAMRSAKKQTQEDLQVAEEELAVVDADLEAAEGHWQALLDRLKQAEENSFGTAGRPVTIREEL
jgi:hypothetical protein